MDKRPRTHFILLSLVPSLRWIFWPGSEFWAGDGGAPPCGIWGAAACAHRRGLFYSFLPPRSGESLAQASGFGYNKPTEINLIFKSVIVILCFQVVVAVNDGTHEFSTKVSPRQGLCAGNWHRITGEITVNTQKTLEMTTFSSPWQVTNHITSNPVLKSPS